MNDIFLTDSLRYRQIQSTVPPNDFFYDKKGGFWCSITDNTLFIDSNGFSNAASKKRDVETGEDQK